jgi:hypothetical protein
MIKENPDDSVREEQNGASENAAGSEDAIKAEEAEKTETPGETEKADEDTKTVTENKDVMDEKTPAITPVESVPVADEFRELEDIELPPVDYSGFSKHELAETLALIIENRPPSEIRDDVERIKTFFYKKLKLESDERKNKFLEGGGKIEDYKIWVDPLDYQVKDLIEKFREKKNDYNKVQEAEKYDNLKKKYDIIDQIKDLVNREESINKTFHDFRSLQNEWHSIGVVPQSSLKDLWENYHHSVEIFYDYIKINKELRDLDLKRNLEAKVILCEKAEELLLEPNPVNAFRLLQDFHNQWREIG